MKKVLITCPTMLDYRPDEAGDIELTSRRPPGGQFFTAGELIDAGIDDYDGVLAGDDEFVEEVFSRAPRLRVISKFGHGTDSIDSVAAVRYGVAVMNTPGVFSEAVAEAAVGYMISLVRGLHGIHSDVAEGGWRRVAGREIGSLTVGVVGVGSVGRAFAQMAAKLGVRLLGCDPKPPPQNFIDLTGMEIVALDELLARSDLISLHCDLNQTSRGLIGRAALENVKRGAFLINTARGPVVDEEALAEALTDGTLAGAALDVYVTEPLPERSRLRSCPGVIFGAHGTFYTREAVRRACDWTFRNVVEFFAEKG